MIRQALALTGLNGRNGAGFIINAQRLAMVIAEIKFGQIAMQMLLAAMLVHAAHTALENREVAFG